MLADAGLTVILGVVFAASTAGATGARALDGLGWVLGVVLARRAVVEERTRIARDLHDILAHAMSVITVQAGVGAHLLERDPLQARKALSVIEGRGALGEIRRLLGALRAGDLPTEPQPGLASLDRLAAQATAAGCRSSSGSRARPLPAGLEVSAYRIAQEAGLLLFAMFFISGGGPPEPILPDGVATAAKALPMAYAVALWRLRDA